MNKEIDITKIVIKTKRLLIRPFKLSDLDDFFSYASVKGVGEKAGWEHHKNKEESLKILTNFIKEKKTFALEYNHHVIGSFGIEKYNEEEFIELLPLSIREIGFVLSKDYWGQGLMLEAFLAIKEYLFSTCQIEALLCSHFVDNKNSERVQEKMGFIHYKDKIIKNKNGEVKEIKINILFNPKNQRK